MVASPAVELSRDAPVQVRGTALANVADWMRSHHDETSHRRFLDALSSESREALEQALGSIWHPIRVLDEVWQTELRVVHDGDRDAFLATLRRQGAHLAEESLSSALRILLILASTPGKLFHSLDRVWANYFDQVEVTLDDSRLAEGHGVCRVRGLGRLRWVGAAAEGWMRVGLEKVGAEAVTVTERHLAEGKDGAVELVFDLHWKPS